MYQTTRRPNPGLLWILTTLSISNPVLQNIKNNWSMNGNITSGKLNYWKCSIFFKDTEFNSTHFSHQLCTLLSYFAPQTNWGNDTLSLWIHILGSAPHMMNLKVLLLLYHKETYFWLRNILHSTRNFNATKFQCAKKIFKDTMPIKQHIWQCTNMKNVQ
jgi:hypothetical protein